MTYKLFVTGKLKESYLKDAVDDYLNRLNHYRTFELIELPDFKDPKNASKKDLEKLKEKEADAFLKQYKAGPIILFDETGKTLDSTQFSTWLSDLETRNTQDLNFVIGGSNGHAATLKQKADYRLSFSKMTFPHGLFRAIALEQMYRAMKIRFNETYHK